MKLRIDGGARVDGTGVRDEEIEVDGKTVIASDGPVGIVITPADSQEDSR